MASKTILLDDLDPTVEATETVLFSIDGTAFEIDLGEKNAAAIRSALSKYTKAGRGFTIRELVKRTENGNGFDPQIVRAWAQMKGLAISDKGRVPEEVVNQWRSAGSPTSW
jgi:hypothetical protein